MAAAAAAEKNVKRKKTVEKEKKDMENVMNSSQSRHEVPVSVGLLTCSSSGVLPWWAFGGSLYPFLHTEDAGQ